MPRYYFNMFDGKDTFDREGTELASAKDARMHMLSVAMTHIGQMENQAETWQMEALDEQGRIVGTMDFGVEDDRHRPH